jgi:hypothetical protein
VEPAQPARADLFGFADVLAVQATSASNHAARVRKAQALPALRAWLAASSAA